MGKLEKKYMIQNAKEILEAYYKLPNPKDWVLSSIPN